MSSTLLAETRIALGKLAEREDVHISTAFRWTQQGCKGIRLESFSVGGRKFTTLPAYDRWLAAINSAPTVSGK